MGMGRPFGLGLRSQLMLALVVAFGAAFVLLSLVTARLDAIDDVAPSKEESSEVVEREVGSTATGEGEVEDRSSASPGRVGEWRVPAALLALRDH